MTKIKICLAVFFVITNFVFAQTNIAKFSSKISYTKPGPAWKVVLDEPPGAGNARGQLMFQHTAIKDSKGRDIEPVMDIMYENIPDTTVVTHYASKILTGKAYRINHKLLGGFPDYSSDKHAIVYLGDYMRGDVKHKLFLTYITYNRIGVEVVCDATDEIFPKVKAEMRAFIKSVMVID